MRTAGKCLELLGKVAEPRGYTGLSCSGREYLILFLPTHSPLPPHSSNP